MASTAPDGLRFVIAKGGSKIHLLPPGTIKALCGHEPKSNYSRRMAPRGGWWLIDMDKKRPEYRWDPESQTRVPFIPWCEKCQQARPAPEEAA